MENQVIVGLSMTVGRKRPYKILQLNVLNIKHTVVYSFIANCQTAVVAFCRTINCSRR